MQVSYNNIGSSLMKLGSADTGVPKLHKGEIVQAVVERILGEGLFRINLKGMTVEAATFLQLNPGQHLLLRSEGMENGRHILRVINPTEEHSSKVANVLRELGFKADERLSVITTKLMQYGLPLTRENIDYVLNTTRLLGDFTPVNLEISTWALAARVDSNPEFLNAFRSFLSGPQSLKTLVQQILQELSNVSVRTGVVMTTEQNVSQQLSLGANQAEMIQNLQTSEIATPQQTFAANPQAAERTVPLPSDAANQPQQVSPSVGGDGIDRPSGATLIDQQAQFLPRDGNVRTSSLGTGNPVSSDALSPQVDVNRSADEMAGRGLFMTGLESIRELFEAMESVMNLKGTDTPEMAQVKLQNFIQSNKELIKALFLTKEVLSRFPDIQVQLGDHVAQLVTAAEEEVLGQAVFNSSDGRINIQQTGFYYFAIPLEAAGQNQTMELRIYKDARGKRRLDELEELRVAVALDTANLGMVVFHVTLKTDDTLQIQGVCSRQGTVETIEGSIDTLLQRLIEKGFKVDYRGMKLATETQPLRPGFETSEIGTPVLGIDVTV